MLVVKNVNTLDGETTDIQISSSSNEVIDAQGLLLLPGLIDPHLSLGSLEQDNWLFGIESALQGGVTTLLDIPAFNSSINSIEKLEERKRRVDERLLDMRTPLQYFPYIKANAAYFEQLSNHQAITKGSMILLSENDSLSDPEWEKTFQVAAWKDLPVVIHLNSEAVTVNPLNGKSLLEKAIVYAEKQSTRLYVLNVSTEEELNLIQEAREKELLIWAETTVEHLYQDDPARSEFLWSALNKGVIETIGSGFFLEEKPQHQLVWNGLNYDFHNPIFLLPLLLTAHLEGKISLETIVRATRINFYEIFKLTRQDETYVLVDLDKEQSVQKANRSHATGLILKGWPVHVVVKGNIYSISKKSNAG